MNINYDPYSQLNQLQQVTQTPQSQLELQIAQWAQQLSQQQYQWGLQQFDNTSKMTQQTADRFLAAGANDQSWANQAENQYQQVTAPEINLQAEEAAQFASPSRIGINMGAAESQQQQGNNAALQQAKQDLQSYGINPSSGTYAELEQASKTAGGAAAAGAGQQAELATEATGRQLLGQSIATGQQLPGQAANFSTAGVAANQAAENATLANANTGIGLVNAGNQSLNAAMNLKYPQWPGYPPTGGTQSSGMNANSGGGGGGGGTQTADNNYESYSGTAGGAGNGVGEIYSERGGIIPEDFAAGGDATQGGFVPQQSSPSGGVNVDDVPANLNAEEFVIPRDVARWKGEEFWHKEIAKSRAARAKAAATVGPTAGPPQAPGQQPAFTSQAYGGGGI